jgi:O-methyltransferase involved in polyketide biosynthesis
LSDDHQRRAVLDEFVADSRCTAVLTEGLLPYLEPTQVRSLARDLLERRVIRYWIQDYYNGDLARDTMRPWQAKLEAVAPLRFSVPDWFAFFAEVGWRPAEKVRMVDEAARLGRRPPFPLWRLLLFALMPRSTREAARNRAGYALLEPA